MNATKRLWTSWLRWSILAFIVHAIVLGLINEWNIFEFHSKEFSLLGYDLFYPRMLEALAVPIFLLVLGVICHDAIEERNKGGISYVNLILSFWSLVSLVIGFVGGICLEVIMLFIFWVALNMPKFFHWLQAEEIKK